jgi:hypothetical protein
MIAIERNRLKAREEQIARLTHAAYHTILERGYHGSFLDLELSLWNAIRTAVEQEPNPQEEAQVF